MTDIQIHYVNGQKEHLYGLLNVIENDHELILFHDDHGDIVKEYISFDVIQRYAITQFVEVN